MPRRINVAGYGTLSLGLLANSSTQAGVLAATVRR